MTWSLRRDDRAEALELSYWELAEIEHRWRALEDWSAWYGEGQQHLRAWLAAGRPAPDLAALVVLGDAATAVTVRATVEKLPDPMAWFVCANVIVKIADAAANPPPGLHTGGWCGDAEPGDPRPIEVGLRVARFVFESIDREVLGGVIAHELSHSWHWDPCSLRQQLPLAGRREWQQSSAARIVERGPEREREAEEAMMLGERAADQLATACGFLVDTCSGLAGIRRREQFRRELAQGAASAAAAAIDVSSARTGAVGELRTAAVSGVANTGSNLLDAERSK